MKTTRAPQTLFDEGEKLCVDCLIVQQTDKITHTPRCQFVWLSLHYIFAAQTNGNQAKKVARQIIEKCSMQFLANISNNFCCEEELKGKPQNSV